LPGNICKARRVKSIASWVELIINLKTAKALAIIFPPAVLAIADEVIEYPLLTMLHLLRSGIGTARLCADVRDQGGYWRVSGLTADVANSQDF
jgi:hypothetical protein